MNASSSHEQRHTELARILHSHNHRYYVLDDPVITDAEYDSLMREIRALEEQNPAPGHPRTPRPSASAPSPWTPSYPSSTPDQCSASLTPSPTKI